MTKKTIKKSNTKAPAPMPAAAKSPAVVMTSSPATPAHREVTFAVYEPAANQVFVSGAFNQWSIDATPLTRKPNRDWRATVALPPGRHEYKFVVDGKWKIDPRSHQFSPNGLGTLNSVIEVKA